jgi:hypothetical protein
MIDKLKGGAPVVGKAMKHEIFHRMEEHLDVVWFDPAIHEEGGELPDTLRGFLLPLLSGLLPNGCLPLAELLGLSC